MSPQDKVERVLKEIHVAFSKSETYNGHPDKVIIDRKQFLNLLDRLNQGIYDMMDQYEQTRQSRNNAERAFRKKGDEIIEAANANAEDVYAASVIYTADMIGAIRELMDHTNDSMNDLFLQFRKDLREQKDKLQAHENELQGQLADLTDTKKYLSIIDDLNKERARKKRDLDAERETGVQYAKNMIYTPPSSPEIKVNEQYFENSGTKKPEEKNMSTKVFFYTLRPFDEQAIVKDLAQQWGVEYGYTEAYPTLENAQLAAGYDAVSLTPCDMSAPMVQRFHDLGVKAICCRSIGYDHVDLEKARELGMKVSNVDYPPNGVANFAIMLMLMSLRKAGHILKRGEVQDYSLKGKIGRDISSCTVGVIGTGRIGQTVLKHLSGFGCSLLAYDLYPNQEVKKIAEYVPLETLLAESDVITLHTNATEENHHLLDAAAFAKMKPGVTIVNTARGKLIDSDALLAALESGQVGAAGLDVLENENGLYYYNRMGDVIPNPELAAFRAMPNVILTDHTAFYTYEDVKSMVRGVLESAAAFAEGSPTRHEVTNR